MDRVRLGRALGYGARHAVKTLASAVEAAAAPSPGPARTAGVEREVGRRARAVPVVEQVVQAHRTVTAAKAEMRAEVKKQGMAAGRSALAPLKTFSSVLWLQVTGTFFTVFAVFLGGGVWRLRGALLAPVASPDAQKAYFYLLVFLVFAYFAVSNFVRARRREKR